MVYSRATSPRVEHPQAPNPEPPKSLQFQFVAEHGRRPHPRSAAMFIVRSQARKYSTMENQRQNSQSRARPKREIRSSPQIPPPLQWVEPLGMGIVVQSKKTKISKDGHLPSNVTKVGRDKKRGSVDASLIPLKSSTAPSPIASPPTSPPATRSIPRKRLRKKNKTLHTDQSVERRTLSRNTARLAKFILSHSERRSSPKTSFGASLDPFQVYPIEAKPWMHNLIDHYVVITKRNAMTWQTENQYPVTGYSRLVRDWLPLCRTDAIGFQSLLLTSELALRDCLGENPWTLTAIRLSLKCLEQIRKRIELGEVTNTMIAAVINIACSELGFVKDPRKFVNHMKGVKQMVRLRGGVDKFNGILKEVIISVYHMGDDDNLIGNAQHDEDEGEGITIKGKSEVSAHGLAKESEESTLSYDKFMESLRVFQPRSFFVESV